MVAQCAVLLASTGVPSFGSGLLGFGIMIGFLLVYDWWSTPKNINGT